MERRTEQPNAVLVAIDAGQRFGVVTADVDRFDTLVDRHAFVLGCGFAKTRVEYRLQKSPSSHPERIKVPQTLRMCRAWCLGGEVRIYLIPSLICVGRQCAINIMFGSQCIIAHSVSKNPMSAVSDVRSS